jgi:hypothetical protein
MRYSLSSAIIAILCLGALILTLQRWPAWHQETSFRKNFPNVAISNNSNILALTETVKGSVWNSSILHENRYTLVKSGPEATTILFSPNDLSISFLFADSSFELWSLGKHPQKISVSNTTTGRYICYSSDGIYVGVESSEEFRIVDCNSGGVISSIPNSGAEVYLAVFSEENTKLFLFSNDRRGRVFDIATRKKLAEIDIPDVIAEACYVGGNLLLAHMNGQVSNWDIAKGEIALFKTSSPIRTMKCLGNNERLFVVSDSIEIWNIKSRSPERVLDENAARIAQCFITSDDRAITSLVSYSSSTDAIQSGTVVTVRDTSNGELLFSTTIPNIYNIAASKAGDRWIAFGNHADAVIWTRYHPEWWWGHFYRLENWLLLIMLVILMLRLRAVQKYVTKRSLQAQ